MRFLNGSSVIKLNNFWALCLITTGLICFLPASAEAEQMTLSSLLSKLKAMPGLQADFREEKHITLLDAPLVSEGKLYFAPPGKLARHISSPAKSRVIIDSGQVSFSSGSKTDHVDLRSNDVIRHFVESFSYLLAGDQAQLERLYTINLTPNPQNSGQWQMILNPRLESMRRLLREVRIQGQGVIISEMRVRETSGDETVTTFSNVNPSRTYSQSERQRLFSIP